MTTDATTTRGPVPTDLARDAGALVLLLSALALPWDFQHEGNDRWWVVAAVVCSLVSLAAPYGIAAGRPERARLSRTVKYVLAVPFLASAVAVVIADLDQAVRAVEDLDLSGGIGSGVGVGLAGALLAAQPRAVDVEEPGAADVAWARACVAMIGVGLLAVVVTTGVYVARFSGDLPGLRSGFLVFALIVLGSYVVPFVVPLVGVVRGDRAWARVLAVVGVSVLGVQMASGLVDDDRGRSHVAGLNLESTVLVAGVFLLVAGVALLLARPVQRRLVPTDPDGSGPMTARNALLLAAATLLPVALARLLGVTTDAVPVFVMSDSRANLALALTGAGVAVAAVGWALLVQHPDRAHAQTVVVAVVLAALGVAVTVVAAGGTGGDEVGWQIDTAGVLGWFVLPVFALWSLRGSRAPA